MRNFTKHEKNLLAFFIVVLLTIVVYSLTSLAGAYVSEGPKECQAALISIQDVCHAKEGDTESLSVLVSDALSSVNGFTIKVFGRDAVVPLVLFRTIEKGRSARVAVPVSSAVTGKIERIELAPILHVDREVLYCNAQTIVYDKDITECS